MLRRRSAPVFADLQLRPQLAALTRPGRRRSRPRTGDKPRWLAVRGLQRDGRRHPSGFVWQVACTAHPTAAWVAQQARNAAWVLQEAGLRPDILLRDRDGKFPVAFDRIFRSEGIQVVRTPIRSPRANAHAECWVGPARRECPDRVLILGERHLGSVLREYVGHYNLARPHRAPGVRPPLAPVAPTRPTGEVLRCDRLDGLIHEYERRVA